jgi:ankyrin repeat protein
MGLASSRPENKDRRFRDAACEGNLARMRTELKHPSGEPDVNAPDARGMTALNLAVLGNHVEAVDLILAQPGVDVDRRDGYGNTALMTAAAGGKQNICEQLLKARASRKAQDPEGKTATVLALERGHILTSRIVERWNMHEQRAIFPS